MNGIERRRRVWQNLKQRLGLKGMGCCGSMWSFRTQTLTIMPRQEEEEEEEDPEEQERGTHVRMHMRNAAASVTAAGAGTTINMNLAMALAAERNLRSGDGLVVPKKNAAGTAVKTLMMLIEETDGGDWQMKKDGDVEGGEVLTLKEGSDWMCCVCMERNKGAAFIPCGHTFCRVCSRDLWLNRGTCPICNRSIIEILDIF